MKKNVSVQAFYNVLNFICFGTKQINAITGSLSILNILSWSGFKTENHKTATVTNGEITKQQLLQNSNYCKTATVNKWRLLQNEDCYKKNILIYSTKMATVTND